MTAERKWLPVAMTLIFISYQSAPFGVLLLVITLLSEYHKKKKVGSIGFKAFTRSKFFIPGIILVASAVIGPIWYGHYASAGLGLLVLAPIVVAACLIEMMWDSEDCLHFARYATLLIIPVCLFSFFFPWSGSFVQASDQSLRLMGTFSNPNYYAYFLVMILMFTLALYYHIWNRSSRNMLIVSGLLGALCLYLTDSRTGMLAFFVGLTVFFLCMSEKTALVLIFGSISILLVMTALFPEHAVLLFKDLIPRHEQFLSEFTYRFMLWEIAFKEIVREPFFGTGIGTYGIFIPADAPAAIAHSYHCHNIYMNFLLELGLAGLLSFLWIVGVVIKRLLSVLPYSGLRPFLSAGIAIIAATLVHGLMDAPLVSSQSISLFGLTLGVMGAVVRGTIEGGKVAHKEPLVVE